MGGDVNESACNTCTSTGSDSDPAGTAGGAAAAAAPAGLAIAIAIVVAVAPSKLATQSTLPPSLLRRSSRRRLSFLSHTSQRRGGVTIFNRTAALTV